MKAGGRGASRLDADTRRQLRRFLAIGLASVATDLAAYALLHGGASLPAAAAKALSYLAGVAVGFCGNKWWTFQSHRRTLAEPIIYLALYLATLVVNVALHRAILASAGEDHQLAAFVGATAVTTALNFVGMKCVTFRAGARRILTPTP